MKSDLSPRGGMHPSIVLAAFIEPLVRGRRVAVLGDATLGLCEALAERGARLVHAYDPDPARVAEALARVAPGRPSAVSQALLVDDLGVRDGAFDVVVVPDLSMFTDATELLRKTRKLCAGAGVAVIGTPNPTIEGRRLLDTAPARGPAPPGYYELYDLVSLQFAKVRMIGQAPFVGYTVADFAAGADPDVSVDTSLLTASEEPEYFIAVAGDRAHPLDGYTVIGLPWASIAEGFGAGAPSTRREDEQLALAASQARIMVLTAELDQVRDRQRIEGDARATSATGLSARVAELEQEIAGREGRLRETEGRAGDSHVRAERLTHQLRDLDEELRRQRERGTRLTKQLDDEKKARTKAEVELGMIRSNLASPPDVPSEDPMTLRRTRGEPVAAAPDAKLLHRLNELEAAVNAAHRETEAAVTARDAALARARQAEAHALRVVELEATLADAQAARHDRDTTIRALEARIEGGDPRVAELSRRLVEREQRIADGRARANDLTQQLDQERARATQLAHREEEALQKLTEAGEQLAELTSHLAEGSPIVAELEARLAAAEQRAAEAEGIHATAEAATAEIGVLESALRERGQQVSALLRDLAESERIGKELIDELVAARAAEPRNAEPIAPAPIAKEPAPRAPALTIENGKGEALELRSRLDALALRAARSEADLQAATWKVTQLERELRERGEAARAPSAVQRELESALASARNELASLRRALGAP